MPPRLAPLDPPYEPALAETLRGLMGRYDVPPLALFRTLAHHAPLLDRFREVGATLLASGALPAADRETLIQRTTARCGAAYEWGVHAALFPRALDLGADWVSATWTGRRATPRSPRARRCSWPPPTSCTTRRR